MRGIVLFEYKSLIFHNFPPFLAHCAELPSSNREVLFSNGVCMQKYNYYLMYHQIRPVQLTYLYSTRSFRFQSNRT